MSGFFSRAANWMYGPMGSGPGETAYLFGPEYTSGPFDTIRGWRPDLASPFDDSRAVGYFRFNTGNTERDALMSILANELGLDNYVRAVAKANEGNWFQDGPGVGAVGEAAMAAGSLLSGISGTGALVRGGFGALRAAPTFLRAAGRTAARPVARSTFAVGGAGAASTVPATVNRTRNLGTRIGNVLVSPAAGYRAVRAAKPVASATAADAGLLRRGGAAVGRQLTRNLPKAAGLLDYGLIGAAGSGLIGDTRLTASQAARVEQGEGPVDMRTMSGAWERNPRLYAYDQSNINTAATPPAAAPMGDTVTTPPADPATPAPTDTPPGPGSTIREDAAGINQQYNNLLRDLRGMFQTSETEEERERIRMMLADIEAQKNAGLEAIASGYAATSGAIRERGVTSREQSAARAAQAGARLAGVGSDLEQRMIDQQAMSAATNRGLGVGAAAVDPTNEWVNLINTLAPIQQNYMTSMGDITGEGIDWLADTTSAQGQAQAADLQRLAFSTATAAELSERQRIADRIQRERELERQALMQIGLAGASAGQSAAQFNAEMALRNRQLDADLMLQQQEASGQMLNDIYGLAFGDGMRPEAINQWFMNRYGRAMTPEEFAMAQQFYRSWLTKPENQIGVTQG